MSGFIRVISGVLVWLLVAYYGSIYFMPVAYIFGVMGFVFMIMIIYAKWWYPKFRRWGRGY